MITIGIDIGKFNHCACVVDHDTGELLVEPFFFKNNRVGFTSLITKINPYQSCLIGLEDSGHYGDNFIFFLLDHGFKVSLINPVTADQKRKAKLKSAKNDKKDAILISKILLDKDEYRIVTKSHYRLRQLKQLTRHHHHLMKDINVYKNRLQKHIDLVFPEFNSLFKSKYGIIYMRLLKQFSSAHNIQKTNIRTLRKMLHIEGRGRKITLTAEHLKLIASHSVGENNPCSEIEIKHLISLIELLKLQVMEIDKKIEEFSHQMNSPILSIPGISHITGMSILSEYGDIRRYASPAQMISFAGVNPYVYQSGTYQAQQTLITKQGNPFLRKSLYQVALTVVHNNSVFQEYYNLKRAQGKSHRCAQGHVIRKLIRIIFHLVTNDLQFDSAKLN